MEKLLTSGSNPTKTSQPLILSSSKHERLPLTLRQAQGERGMFRCYSVFYLRIYHRHPRPIAAKKAIVAVSRKLTTRIYSVLHEQRNYVVHSKTNSVPLTEEETGLPQEMTRRQAEVRE